MLRPPFRGVYTIRLIKDWDKMIFTLGYGFLSAWEIIRMVEICFIRK